MNGFGEQSVLQIGQVIRVPVVEEPVIVETTPLVTTRQAVVGPEPADAGGGDFNNYTLMQFNGGQAAQVDSSLVVTAQTGTGGPTTNATQVAMAKSEGAGATATVLAEHAVEEVATLYVVEPGDTIVSIAIKHGLEWGELLSLNGLSEESVLQLGQTIRLR